MDDVLSGGPPVPHAAAAPGDCLVCHDAAGQNWPAPPGHAAFTGGQCQLCHEIGNGNPIQISHAQVADLMLGRHAQAGCVGCHTAGGFRDTPTSCIACHEGQDIHAERLDDDCARCHEPIGWSEVAYDHTEAAFQLLGPHQAVACAQCHANDAYAGTPKTCIACHQADDRHAGQLGTDCAQCHTPERWQGARVDHNLTAYPLTGRHLETACTQCHGNDTYTGTPQTCIACHRANDRHAGQLGTDCAQCHTPERWQGASIDHNLTAFPLTGRHIDAGCTECHPNNSYSGTPQTCIACHQADDRHAGQFGTDCAQCHTPEGWQGASVDHNLTAFPLAGRHVEAVCAQCHLNNSYAGTPQSCIACHQASDLHAGQFGTDCAECHTPEGWLGASLDHNLTTFPLTGRHQEAACAQCHANNSYAGTPQACIACHQTDDRHAGQFGADCAQCHTTEQWLGANTYHDLTTFPLTGRHMEAACSRCHPSNSYAGTPVTCSACHDEPAFHAGLLGTNCADCHGVDGWHRASFGRRHTFPINHGRDASCRTCHPDTLAGYDCSPCHDSREVDEEHREEGKRNYVDCVACHPAGDDD
jgi:hypothetical protein